MFCAYSAGQRVLEAILTRFAITPARDAIAVSREIVLLSPSIHALETSRSRSPDVPKQISERSLGSSIRVVRCAQARWTSSVQTSVGRRSQASARSPLRRARGSHPDRERSGSAARERPADSLEPRSHPTPTAPRLGRARRVVQGFDVAIIDTAPSATSGRSTPSLQRLLEQLVHDGHGVSIVRGGAVLERFDLQRRLAVRQVLVARRIAAATAILDDQQIVLLTRYETTEMERERQRLQIAITGG
jgi:hypothetical protein